MECAETAEIVAALLAIKNVIWGLLLVAGFQAGVLLAK